MNNILTELEFEDYIIERLMQGNGYIERDHTYYDDKFAADRELLMRFLSETQPETMAQLKKVFKVCGRNHPIPHRAQPENAAFPL